MTTISPSEVAAFGPNFPNILDLRKHEGASEIRGSIHYDPEGLLSAKSLALPLNPDQPVVLYTEDGSADETVTTIAQRLVEAGWTDVRLLDGGFAAWKSAGLPLQEASMDQPIP